MVAIVTRAGKGSPLTNAEVDSNFTNLNSGKVENTQAGILAALGFTPANKAGDTFTGNVVVSSAASVAYSGQVSAGTGKWNLFMDGSAQNFFAGNLLIGSSSLANGKVVIGGSLTGQPLMSALRAEMTIQSDVTTGARGFQTLLATQAASFTLTDIIHYRAVQGTFGAGSTVTSQNAFVADASLIGAGTNIGFRGAIPSGSNRWNLYMDGTASNFIAGATIFGNALGFGAVGSPSYGTTNQVLTSQGSSSTPSWQGLKTVNGNSILGTGDIVIAGGVTSFNTRTGAVTLSSSDVTTALGYTPYNSSNPSGYITSSALSSYLPLSGGTLTGNLTSSGLGDFTTPNSGTTGGVRVRGNATSGTAYIQFVDSGATAQWGVLSITSSGTLNYSGAFTAAGNITSNSDERLKSDWTELSADFVERLALVKHGTYTRIDSGERQAGASAQAVQALLPETVSKGADDILSLAYGNAALVSAIQLAQRVVSLTARLRALEQKMGA